MEEEEEEEEKSMIRACKLQALFLAADST